MKITVGSPRKDSPKKSSSDRHVSRVERQKICRYEHLMNWRFLKVDKTDLDVWSDNGYSSFDDMVADDHIDQQLPIIGNNSQIIAFVFACEPTPQLEPYIDSVVKTVLNDIDNNNDQQLDHYLNINFINKMMSFIGSNVSKEIQIKILKMFDDLMICETLSSNLANVMASQMMNTIINSCVLGDDEVMASCLRLFGLILDAIHMSDEECGHYLKSHISLLITALIQRVDDIKWRTSRVEPVAKDGGHSKRHTVFGKEISPIARQLFTIISHFVSQMLYKVCGDCCDTMSLCQQLFPLISKLFGCDPHVDLNVLHMIDGMVCMANSTQLILAIVNSFRPSLLASMRNPNESVVFKTLQVMNAVFNKLEINEKLCLFEGIGYQLIINLMAIMAHKSYARNMCKDVISLVEKICQLLAVIETQFGCDYSHICDQLTYWLIHISLSLDTTCEKLEAVLTVQTVLSGFNAKQLNRFKSKAKDLPIILQNLLTKIDQNYCRSNLTYLTQLAMQNQIQVL